MVKSFAITPGDLTFLQAQVKVPTIRVVRYLLDGTPIYGYTVPATGYIDPLTGQAPLNNVDPFTLKPLPKAGSVVELGIIATTNTPIVAGVPSVFDAATGKTYTTFDVFNTAWSLFLPPVVTATGTTPAGVGEPFGLRNVQGLFNNISLSSSAIWGAGFYAFARSSDAAYGNYLQQRSLGNPAFKALTDVTTLSGNDPAVPNSPPAAFSKKELWSNLNDAQKLVAQGNANYGLIIDEATGNVNLANRYANPFLSVYDYTPRMISQLVDSQTALERMDAASGGAYLTDTITYDLTNINDGSKTYDVTESFQRNLNTLGGDPSLTGWQTLFGQFFDHGLDAIGKGGNKINGVGAKIYIPLDPSDPLYRAPGTNGVNDPGNTRLYISRATVDNPLAAGADGMFRTADDILSPGADGIYIDDLNTPVNEAADNVTGPTNPNYVNHTSPYIDQSQTYGSDDTTTNLLREWVKSGAKTGSRVDIYKPGMYLFDGTTLANAWNRTNPDGTTTTTKQTLPTLNELRAYLIQTGRDDLSWGDIDNLRVRDASGNVLDIDPSPSVAKSVNTGHTLIADFLPRIDATHLFYAQTVKDYIAASGVDVLSSFEAANTLDKTDHIERTSGTPDGSYISDYFNLQSGQPTALAKHPATGELNAIAQEILLRSIGDHYVAGDGRANENFGLTAIHHVWHENHNWQIDNLINMLSQQTAAVRNSWQVDTGIVSTSNGNYIDSSGAIAWDQEKMFQAATLINQAEYQHVAIDQYARGLTPNIPLFFQYDAAVNSDVSLDYSQVAFRFGHSQLRETIDTLDPTGSLTGAVTRYALEQAFLNPSGFAKTGPTAIAQGMTRQVSNEIDEIVTPALQQNLLGQATDLAAINIARGRDLGMPTLNNLRRQLSAGLTAQLKILNQKLIANPGDTTLRQTIDKTIALQAGLQAYNSWTDFGNAIQHPEALVNFIAAYSFDGNLEKADLLIKLSDGSTLFSSLTDVQQALFTKSVAEGGLGISSDLANPGSIADEYYSSAAFDFLTGGDKGYEAIDAWNGGLAEKHVFLGQLGTTFDTIFADQMTRLINGDRFYYLWRFDAGLPMTLDLNSSITTEQFKDVIERTTGAKHLTGDVFFYADSHIELSERPASTALGQARDHKYGDLLASNDANLFDGGKHIGVASIGPSLGVTDAKNGTVSTQTLTIEGTTQTIKQKFILDVRPDTGVNPDGTAAVGFNAHEVIAGTQFNDFLDAGDGDDTEYGDAGDDTLIGNAGADHLYGDAGNDVLYGGTLPDFLDGGTGNDTIHGGDDADVLIGDEGNDWLYGENFTDEIHGGAGDDYLDGGLEADVIFGGTGQDIVLGDEGLDVLNGQSGDDRLFAGAGPDQLFGGYGDDIMNAGSGGQVQSANVDEAVGDFGFNIVSFSDITIPLNHSADLGYQNVNNLVPQVTPFGQLWVNIQGVEGSQYNDTILGYIANKDLATGALLNVDATLLNNWMIGGSGNDTISSGAGDDVMVGDSVSLVDLIGSYSGGVLGSNGILDYAYGVNALASKHFLDLQKSVPGFTFGDTVNITGNGLVYTHQAVNGSDTAIYAGARSNFVISVIVDPSNPNVALGLKIKDARTGAGAETGANGDIVLGVETFIFANQTFSIPQLIAPAITGISGDTGSSQTDGITNDGTLILSGTGIANSLIQVYRSGQNGTPIGSATADNTGKWTFDYGATTSLLDGAYAFTAIALIAGYTSLSSAPFNVTVDTVALAPTLALANDSGLSSTDKITNSGVVNVSGLETGASWQYSTNSGGAWTTGSGTSFSLTGDGAKSVIVRQTDLAANTSSSSSALAFTLDTTAPVKTTTITSMTKDTGTSATDFITNDGTAGRTYSGTLSAALIAGEYLQVSVDGGTTWGAPTIATTSPFRAWTFVDNTAKTGNWTILARVVDTAGNSGAVTTRNVVLDQLVPGATSLVLDLTAATDSGVSNTDNLTNVARAGFTITFDSTKAQAGDTLQVVNSSNTVLGSTTLTAALAAAGTVNVTLPAATPLSSGVNTLFVNYRDVAGNSVASATTLAVTFDNQISAANAVTLDLLASSDSGVSNTDNITNITLPTFAITFDSTKTQLGDVIEVRRGNTVLGSATLGTADQVSLGTVNVTLTSALSNGTNTYLAVQRDAAGNTVTGTPTLSVTLDTSANAPIAAGYTPTSVNGTAEANAIVKFSTSASAPTTFVGSATATNAGAYSLDATGLTGSTAGTSYYLYAQDVAGNQSPASSQQLIVGTNSNDTFSSVGGSGGDLLIGGTGTDLVQYAVSKNAIALTGQISNINAINIRTANIDVITGVEQIIFSGTGYTAIGTAINQLRDAPQSSLANNSIAEFLGVYNATSGAFTFGGNAVDINATLVTFDSNPGNATNYEALLLLGKTSISGTVALDSGAVSLMGL